MKNAVENAGREDRLDPICELKPPSPIRKGEDRVFLRGQDGQPLIPVLPIRTASTNCPAFFHFLQRRTRRISGQIPILCYLWTITLLLHVSPSHGRRILPRMLHAISCSDPLNIGSWVAHDDDWRACRRSLTHDHGWDARSRTHCRLHAAPSSHTGPHDQAARPGLHAFLDDDRH